jgi:hypothetical protein
MISQALLLRHYGAGEEMDPKFDTASLTLP